MSSQILQIFYIINHHIDMTCRAQHLGRHLEGQGHSMTFQHNCVRPRTLLFLVLFKNYFTEMITMLRRCVAHNILVATLKVKVTVWPFSKIVLAHNFVIWSRILQLFHINDHHIKTTSRVQHLGCYLEGQGHSMTLQQNRVWPKTLLFEVVFYNYFDKLLFCVQYLFGEHYPVPTGSC